MKNLESTVDLSRLAAKSIAVGYEGTPDIITNYLNICSHNCESNVVKSS
jgi:hypothetical protein